MRIENRVISRKYTNSKGIGKERVRNRVNNLILRSKVDNPLILTLPGEYWIWEKSLLSVLPSAKFVGVERDSRIVKNTVLNSVDIITSISAIYNEPLSNILHSSLENSFSHIIMDYCCTINTVIDEISYTIDNNLVMRDGIISITLSKMNIQPNTIINDVASRLPADILGFVGSESSVATKLLISDIIINNPEYILIDVLEYRDTSAMIVFIIKRN